jgi:2-oxoglutarate dehydrogenase complex dehydrogenase (E1) component-like enzyme
VGELAGGGFRPVLDDEERSEKGTVRRLVLCSGKLAYDLLGHELRAETPAVAVARIEQLYPFPLGAGRGLVGGYAGLEEIVWAQEEPQNMGAWRTLRHRLEEIAGDVPVRYVGRPWRASPSEGYPTAHLVEQDRILREALTLNS